MQDTSRKVEIYDNDELILTIALKPNSITRLWQYSELLQHEDIEGVENIYDIYDLISKARVENEV